MSALRPSALPENNSHDRVNLRIARLEFVKYDLRHQKNCRIDKITFMLKERQDWSSKVYEI